tara:strand:- start:1756 stop:2781 length:1026 start_codon:yes stop_codon:yes gene_type:complete
MGRILPLVLSIFLLTSSSLVYNASAQNPLPDIDIDCDPESRIDVYPGSTYSGFFTCTLSNPTTYSEEVEVTITSGSLLSTGPGTVTVGPSATLDIQISLRAEQGMSVQNIAVETKAVVVSFNGIDAAALPEASDTADTVAMIMQYSAPTIQLTEAEITLTSGQDYDYDVIYGNNGNGDFDKMLIGIEPYSIDELETEGFSIYSLQSIEIESGQTKTVKWEIRAPKGVTKEEYHIIDFYVTSEFSCRYEGFCNTEYVMLTVKVIPEEEEGGLASLTENSAVTYSAIGGGVLAAAVAIVIFMKRKKSSTFEQDDYEEDFEEDIDDDFDDDFDDDLDDDFFDDL